MNPTRNAQALLELRAIDPEAFVEDDQVLRDAALRLGESVAALPSTAPPVIETGEAALSSVAADADDAGDVPLAIEMRVSDTLAEIDQLLRDTQ